MFPPPGQGQGQPPKKKPPGPGGPPQGGPPDPFAGGDPFGPAPAAGPPQGGPGMDPLAGMMPPPGPPAGMPKPGQGMDPMAAMMQGLGPDPFGGGMAPPQGPPLGPGGLPVGGSLPRGDGDGDETMGGSDLLQALAGSLGDPGDPYGQPPGAPGQMFQGIGQGDPSMGLQQLLQMFALGQMGVGGGPGGLAEPDPFASMGTTVGF